MRELPIVNYNGQFYFKDDRLQQLRNISNPHDYIDFKSIPDQDWEFITNAYRGDTGPLIASIEKGITLLWKKYRVKIDFEERDIPTDDPFPTLRRIHANVWGRFNALDRPRRRRVLNQIMKDVPPHRSEVAADPSPLTEDKGGKAMPKGRYMVSPPSSQRRSPFEVQCTCISTLTKTSLIGLIDKESEELSGLVKAIQNIPGEAFKEVAGTEKPLGTPITGETVRGLQGYLRLLIELRGVINQIPEC